MPSTRGGLEPATIVNLSTNAEVHCMFNPHEYTVAKQNQWTNDEVKGKNVPKVKFSQGGAQTMSLQLVFDTFADATDVRTHTQELWNMMMVTEDRRNPRNNKSEPPRVEFRWGQFSFRAIITQVSQKFSLSSKMAHRSGLPWMSRFNKSRTRRTNLRRIQRPVGGRL